MQDLPIQRNGYHFPNNMSADSYYTSSYIHNNFVSAFCRFDCGMFMLKYIDFYSRGLDLCFTQVKSPEITKPAIVFSRSVSL